MNLIIINRPKDVKEEEVIERYKLLKGLIKSKDLTGLQKIDAIDIKDETDMLLLKLIDKVLQVSKLIGVRGLIVSIIKKAAEDENEFEDIMFILRTVYPKQFSNVIMVKELEEGE